MHGSAEDMGAGFFAQRIVNDGDDVLGKKGQQEMKQDMAQRIG